MDQPQKDFAGGLHTSQKTIEVLKRLGVKPTMESTGILLDYLRVGIVDFLRDHGLLTEDDK